MLSETVSPPKYERFKIETKLAPQVHPVPNKFDVSAKRIRLAAMLIHEALEFKLNKEVVLSRPCIYGVFGGHFGGFKPIKSKCVGCMRCVQEYPHIMNVRLSDSYKKLGDSYWTPDAVSTIWYEASTGKIPVRGMGYKGSFGGEGFDGIWTDMSEIVRPTRDGVFGREYISTVVDIGRKSASLNFERAEETVRTVNVPIPIIFDALPASVDNDVVRLALETAAKRLHTFYVSKPNPEAIPSESRIPLVTGGEAYKYSSLLENAPIIEYDADQAEMGEKLRQLHPLSVVAARFALTEDSAERASKLVKEGAGVLHLCADHHGMDYSAKPRHISDALKSVHDRLVEDGTRDLVTIIAGGGVILAEHVPKTIIRGADLVAIDTTLLVALQAEFSGETRDRESCRLKMREIDPEWGSQRIVNLMASWHDQLIEILSAMGMRDVRRLRGDVGRSMVDSELREQAFGGITWAT